MADFMQTVQRLFAEAIEPPKPDDSDPAPPLPTVLSELGDTVKPLFSIGLEPTGDGIDDWLAKFRALTGDVSLRETLLLRVLQVKLPRVAEALTLAGVISAEWGPGPWVEGTSVPRAFRIDWNALDALTTSPGDHFLTLLVSRVTAVEDVKVLQVLLLLLVGGPRELLRLEYQRKGFLALPAAANPGVNLSDLTSLVNSPIALPLPPPPVVHLGDLKKGTPLGAWGNVVFDGPGAEPGDQPFDVLAHLGIQVNLAPGATTATRGNVPLDDRWRLVFDMRASQSNPIATLSFDQKTLHAGGTPPSSEFGAFITRTPPNGEKDALLIGKAEGTHFSIQTIKAGVRFGTDPNGPLFSYVLQLDPVEFAVAADLLKTLAMGLPIPGVLKFSSAVETAFRQGVGLAAQGAAGGSPALGIEFSTHLGLAIGGAGAGLWVDDMLSRFEVSFTAHGVLFRAMFRFDARAALGPVKATMSGGGVWFGRWTDGNAGILPPTGIGLSVAAGPISGGGFLKQYGPGKFGGALQLKILGVGVFAYGLYEEIPDGVSIAAIIGIRLPLPGIQIGFGFAVSGFGGLIGINRRSDLDALRSRLQSGTAGDVLFTDDPMKNAPKLLGEMEALFPKEPGVHVFGPTMQLNWCSLLTLDLGLFIELPGPRKVFIAGSARLVIGSEDFSLVYVRLDFVGGVDLTASLIFFDGVLVNSSVLGVITITGGVALRIGFGGNPYFVYSVGGFHPAFNPGDLPMPAIPRAGAALSLGPVWFKQEMYLAITSNTLQFGSNTEAGVKIGPISVHGWFRFDALIQYRPFHFDASIDAGMEASYDGWSFASIRVQGRLTGPGPLVLSATASVRIIIKISKDVTITLDDNPPESLPPVPSLAVLLRPELNAKANVRAEGTDPDVVFATTDGLGDRIVPIGRVVWEQKRVPLAQLIQRAEGRDLDTMRKVTVEWPGHVLEDAYDEFGHGTFMRLTDADALAAPTFVSCRSGFSVSGAGAMQSSGARVPSSIDLTIIRLPERKPVTARFGDGTAIVTAATLSLLSERASGASVKTEAPLVAVDREEWTVQGAAGSSGSMDAMAAYTMGRITGSAAMPAGAVQVALGGVF